jgi:hypothetical protein
MDEKLRIAEAVQAACIEAALRAYEDAGLSGLCREGQWERAVDAMRGVSLCTLLQTLAAQQQSLHQCEVDILSGPSKISRFTPLPGQEEA